MVRVIMGFNVSPDIDIQPILLDLRSYALQCPGFMTAENPSAQRNYSIIIYVTSWQSVANWNFYEKSIITQKLLQRIRELSVEEPKVTIYRPLPTMPWR